MRNFHVYNTNCAFQESIAEETRQKLSLSTKLREAGSELDSVTDELSGASEEIRILQQKQSELQTQVSD